MSDKTPIAVAMSGGVDSSVAAHLLRAAGYAVSGVTFTMFDGAAEPPGVAAAAVCAALGIPHETVGAQAEFAAAVMADFCHEYAAGRTPNPCVVCNRQIKFPLLCRYADTLAPGSSSPAKIATGHYARVVERGGRLAIARAADAAKDQSYMLWQLPQDTLARLVLPLGELTKPEIREIARENALPSAAATDSQDICFIPDGDYVAYLARAGVSLPPGTFVDESGAPLGAARNQACYTIGQRRGLGIALGQYMYVTARDAAENRVTISPRDPQTDTVVAGQIAYMAAAPGELEQPRRLSVKLRYARAEYPCTAAVRGERITVTLDAPVRAPAPGQSLVLYDGDVIIAGGIIEGA